ncbi:hypothetical protein TNCV_3573661 [Trichonephila clavipes]|nr:hypothetical protein TNCV_3573661 [Trichonephila clavipes]
MRISSGLNPTCSSSWLASSCETRHQCFKCRISPYTGPHEVLSRNDKHITININGKKSCVSLDRVKPAFVFKDLPDTLPDPIISAESSHRHPVTTNMQTTKSGRRILLQTMIPAYNKKRCAAFPFETGIHLRRKTDFFPEEGTTMSYSGFEPEQTRLQAEGHSHHTGWATYE